MTRAPVFNPTFSAADLGIRGVGFLDQGLSARFEVEVGEPFSQ